ncbi:PREDICTED: uncharacterized protein LOC104598834 [Nelumbo nucifera]|uniref:Uncharacterized protein LOC104598834 n=2 Tax=Nelumbo nucifera TaxID=4432 RepID=A0A1U8ACD2_NELNU|nr:PREDICTED: uncharacterized protein LOC104598834 [Nelumbo nucifera]XP_019053587.1 PREDICTED: uncharacterized protein LOC104598834 [Nelumbo nucifera]DAD38206.1 TPA_asm: hypothetical protein HUJ06_008847 [Nelumbo nucifera]
MHEEMGTEKHTLKNGAGYVGGFLQLFDWNAKSRKKLFSNRSDGDEPEGLKQGKRSEGNLPMTRLRLTEEDEIGGGSSIKGSSDYSCASSVTDEEGYGTRPPGVVARLMGLDSLPTSNVAEPYSTPFFDSRSLRDAQYQKRTLEFHNERQIMHSGNLSNNKIENFSRNSVEPRPQKIPNRPIERFQTEILPPKSAKSIPITHHKLLSPIKSPGFVPTKNAAHIMEAAAKIIEPGPQAMIKGKMPSLSSSSIPLKVRDFKEKLEAAQRPSRIPEASRRPLESNAVKHLKGQSLNKSWNGSEDTPQFRASPDSEESNSSGLKNKGKSISLAIQAKVNVQRREGLGSSTNRSLLNQKEQTDVKSNQQFKNQKNAQKNMQRKSSTQSATGVLRQNNQKQNCTTNKDKLPSKPSGSNQQSRKILSGDASFGRSRTLNKVSGNSKVGCRKIGLEVTDIEKEVSSSRTNSFPRKKRSIDGDFHFEKNGVVSNILVDKDEKHVQSNIAVHSKWTEDNTRKGMDVVSFTFTSPMIKSVPGSQSSGQVVEKSSNSSLDTRGEKSCAEAKSSKLSSLGLNVIGGDALSILLEQKLRELTYGVESSCRNSVKAGIVASSASILQDLVSALNAVSTTPREIGKGSQVGVNTDNFGSMYNTTCSSTDAQMFKMDRNFKGRGGMDDCSSSNREVRKELNHRHPSPVSVLDPSFSNESCNSSDSGDSYSTNGNKWGLSIQAQEVGSSCSRKFHSGEAETELSDSASSMSTETLGRKHATKFDVADDTRSTKWELEYVREILCNVELMFKDFTIGRAHEIINPRLFDQLENRKTGLRNQQDWKDSRLRWKMVFDCVSECMDLRCRRCASGGCETWAKGLSMVRRKKWLAEEVYKEISGWRSMGDSMVDELVDKDMSSQYGRWLDFEIEAFELGVEIEQELLSSLVDEVFADIISV